MLKKLDFLSELKTAVDLRVLNNASLEAIGRYKTGKNRRAWCRRKSQILYQLFTKLTKANIAEIEWKELKISINNVGNLELNLFPLLEMANEIESLTIKI